MAQSIWFTQLIITIDSQTLQVRSARFRDLSQLRLTCHACAHRLRSVVIAHRTPVTVTPIAKRVLDRILTASQSHRKDVTMQGLLQVQSRGAAVHRPPGLSPPTRHQHTRVALARATGNGAKLDHLKPGKQIYVQVACNWRGISTLSVQSTPRYRQLPRFEDINAIEPNYIVYLSIVWAQWWTPLTRPSPLMQIDIYFYCNLCLLPAMHRRRQWPRLQGRAAQPGSGAGAGHRSCCSGQWSLAGQGRQECCRPGRGGHDAKGSQQHQDGRCHRNRRGGEGQCEQGSVTKSVAMPLCS